MEPGDAILCEEYTYPHVPESLVSPAGYKSIGVRIDEGGVVPELLRETLEGLQSRGGKLPKLLYTVPVGQNPTGQGLACRAHLFGLVFVLCPQIG